MKFGLVYPNRGELCNVELMTRSCELAESLGLDSFVLWDHFIQPNTPRTLEAWTSVSYLAGRTSSIRLGTCVTPVPIWPAPILAKAIATADNLSGGRIIFGAGAGRHEPEFEVYSPNVRFEKRFAVFEESMRQILSLWTRSTEGPGRVPRSERGEALEPKPVQRPYVSTWFGTNGRRLLGLLAEVGSGWVPYYLDTRVYRERKKELLRLLRAKKRSPNGFTFAAHIGGPPDLAATRREIEAYRKAGCDYVVIPCRFGAQDMLPGIRDLGELTGSF